MCYCGVLFSLKVGEVYMSDIFGRTDNGIDPGFFFPRRCGFGLVRECEICVRLFGFGSAIG